MSIVERWTVSVSRIAPYIAKRRIKEKDKSCFLRMISLFSFRIGTPPPVAMIQNSLRNERRNSVSISRKYCFAIFFKYLGNRHPHSLLRFQYPYHNMAFLSQSLAFYRSHFYRTPYNQSNKPFSFHHPFWQNRQCDFIRPVSLFLPFPFHNTFQANRKSVIDYHAMKRGRKERD